MHIFQKNITILVSLTCALRALVSIFLLYISNVKETTHIKYLELNLIQIQKASCDAMIYYDGIVQ